MSDECRDRAIDAIARSDRSQFTGIYGKNGLDDGQPTTLSKEDLLYRVKTAAYVDFPEPKLRIYPDHYQWYEFSLEQPQRKLDPWTTPTFWEVPNK